MSMAVKRTAAAGGADAQQTTAAGVWTQITATMVAAGWTAFYTFNASDIVYSSPGESGTRKCYLRYTQSGNQLDTTLYQHFVATNATTGVGVDGSTLTLWAMEEPSGTAVADSAGNFNLTTVNGPTVVAGLIGTNARFFTRASAQNMTATGNSTWRNLFQTGNFTIEGWAKPTVTSTQQGLVGCNASGVNSVGHLHVNTSGQLVFEYRNAANNAAVTLSGGAGTTFTAGAWSHFAVTRTRIGANNNTIKFYLNGVLATTFTAQVDPIAPTTQDVWVGRTTDASGNNAGAANSYDGTLDHIRVSNVARTDTEILTAYWGGAPQAGSGFNALGGVISKGRYTFTAGTTLDYIVIADLDSVTWAFRNTSTAATWHGCAGLLDKHPIVKPTLITDSSTYQVGSVVTINVTSNPIAAGYEVDDPIMIVSQQAFGSLEPGVAPVFMTYIRALTTSSITVDQVREAIGPSARIGEDPMPYFLLDGVTSSNPVTTATFLVANTFHAGKKNIYRDSQSLLANAPNGYSQTARSWAQENNAESDPSNRTGRQIVDRLHIYGTGTGTSDQAPIDSTFRGYVPRLRYCTDQTKAQWAIGRDIKLIEDATNCDYTVTLMATQTIRFMIGPFTQAGASSFSVQPITVLTEDLLEGGTPAPYFADHADPEPTKRLDSTDFLTPVGEELDLDEGLIVDGTPNEVRSSYNPPEVGTGPYLLGDGDRTGGAGGSNFNQGFN